MSLNHPHAVAFMATGRRRVLPRKSRTSAAGRCGSSASKACLTSAVVAVENCLICTRPTCVQQEHKYECKGKCEHMCMHAFMAKANHRGQASFVYTYVRACMHSDNDTRMHHEAMPGEHACFERSGSGPTSPPCQSQLYHRHPGRGARKIFL